MNRSTRTAAAARLSLSRLLRLPRSASPDVVHVHRLAASDALLQAGYSKREARVAVGQILRRRASIAMAVRSEGDREHVFPVFDCEVERRRLWTVL